MKYNGTNWVNVGIAGFSAGEADNITIAIDNHGAPYVIFEDPTTSNLGATVMKYNGANWVFAGTPGFTTGLDALNTTMAIDKNGDPYACFQQFPGGLASVMKYDAATEVKSVAGSVSSALLVYPNPATTQITISAPGKISTITVSNLLGQTMYSQHCNAGEVHVAIADLPAGVYFVKVNGTEIRKFVKQ